jgi:hypothetical protein
MADARYNLHPAEGEGDAEFFEYIAAHKKEWSTPTPELEAVSVFGSLSKASS